MDLDFVETKPDVISRTRPLPPQGLYLIAELARKEGISEKFARGRLRQYYGGTLRDLGISSWTYGPEHLELIKSIILRSDDRSTGSTIRRPSAATQLSTSEPAAVVATTVNAAEQVDFYSWPRKPRSELTLPEASGVYALFLRKSASLSTLVPLKKGLIYIGLGSSIIKRCHFVGKTDGHSPRRSLAALLWHELELEPVMAANGHYKLTQHSERRLDDWMHRNLLMSFAACNHFKEVEDALIRQFSPPLNLNKCLQSEQHRHVKRLRNAMREYAIAHH